ncbi:unnamed protein product, partial [marine sediment metagenome]
MFDEFRAKRVLSRCVDLRKEIYNLPSDLNKLRKTDPKKYNDIKIKLRDIV